jgi:hypothetical protein
VVARRSIILQRYVITRNGKTTVIEGWQAWLLSAALLVGFWLLFVLVFLLFIGASITIGLLLLLLIPALGIAALFGRLFDRR